MFKVKDIEGIKDPKFSLKCPFSQIFTNLTPPFGLSPTQPTLSSYLGIPNAVQGREWNLEPLNL
jgi:hypothetical protein